PGHAAAAHGDCTHGRDVPGSRGRCESQRPDDRDLRPGAQDRGLHRADAAIRHRGAGPHWPDRPGARQPEQGRRPMSTTSQPLTSATRPVNPALASLLQGLKPGQRIRITQTVRVGLKRWTTTVVGTFRDLKYLATGLATDRVPEDDIIVPMVHFTKDNGELSSVALDEHTRLEILDGGTDEG